MTANDDVFTTETAAGVFHDRKGFGHDFLKSGFELVLIFDGVKALFPFGGAIAQLLLGEILKRSFDLVDLRHDRAHALHFPVIPRPNDLLDDVTNHLRKIGRDGTGWGYVSQGKDGRHAAR